MSSVMFKDGVSDDLKFTWGEVEDVREEQVREGEASFIYGGRKG